MVKVVEYIGTTKLIKVIHGEAKQKPRSVVKLGVGRYELDLLVVVLDECEIGVLLGLDTGVYGLLHGVSPRTKRRKT